MIELSQFHWTERSGRFPDDSPFDEMTFDHASGRIMAAIQGPQDKRGGFTHSVTFLFSQDVTMRGSPFVFVDFDSAKRFVEYQVGHNLTSINELGAVLEIEKPAVDLGLGPVIEQAKQLIAGIAARNRDESLALPAQPD